MTDRKSAQPPSESAEQDKLWITRALEGDESAYALLVEKYQNALYHHVRKIVRDKSEVDDLVQESFIKAFAALDSYSTQYAFSTWLYKIATNPSRRRKGRWRWSCRTRPIDPTGTYSRISERRSSRRPSTRCRQSTTV